MEISNHTLSVTVGPLASAEPLLQQEISTTSPHSTLAQVTTLMMYFWFLTSLVFLDNSPC